MTSETAGHTQPGRQAQAGHRASSAASVTWPAAVARAGRYLQRAAALYTTAAFTAGVPVGLIHYEGWPLPRHIPAWSRLPAAVMAAPGGTAIAKVLACGVWLAWLVFATCLATEIIAALKGRPAPKLPGLAPAQALAAALAGGLTLTAVTLPALSTPLAPLPAGLHPSAGAGGRPASLAAGPRPTSRNGRPCPCGQTQPPRSASPGAASRAVRRAYRVVAGDTLWDIAARYLGDPHRWREIFALNQDRPQPGGRSLTDPGLIYPGWILRLPGHTARPQHTRPPSRPSAGHAAGGRHRRPPAPPAPEGPSASHSTATPHPAGHGAGRAGSGIHLPGGGLAGAALAAAISTAVVLAAIQRARRYRPGLTLATSLRPTQPPLPAAIAVLRAAARSATSWPGGRPAAQAGPEHPPAAGSTPHPAGAARAARPGMIAIGIRGGAEVCTDLAALGGLGLTGPGAPGVARALLAALLASGLPGQPARPAEVIIPAADAAVLLPGWEEGGNVAGLTVTATTREALDQAEAALLRLARERETDEVTDQLPEDSADRAQPAVVLITSPEHGGQRLAGLLDAGRHAGLAGIVLGAWPPGVTCHVIADGQATSADPALDGAQLFHLDAGTAAALAGLLQQAHGTTASGHDHPAPVPGGPPAAWGHDAQPPGHPTPPPAPAAGTDASWPPGRGTPAGNPPVRRARRSPAVPGHHQHRQRSQAEQVIRVEILGPVRITAKERELQGGLRKARELAAFLALHPDGASGHAISEALWPGSPPGYGTRQRSLALRKLRVMLRAATGLAAPMLITLSGGRYRLDPTYIATDAADFQAALDQARTATSDGACLAACQEAAALYRGPLAEGEGYEWAEPYAETARRRALDAWTRIAELVEPTHPDQALAALETALGHDPYNEFLYQKIMRLQATAGHPEAVRRTLSLLETRLTGLGITPSAQTRHVAASLLGTHTPPSPPPPGRRPPPGATPGGQPHDRRPS